MAAWLPGFKATRAKRDYTKSLPVELIENIFSRLDPISLLSAGAVKGQWRRIVQRTEGHELGFVARLAKRRSLELFPSVFCLNRPSDPFGKPNSRGVAFASDSKSVLIAYKTCVRKIDLVTAYAKGEPATLPAQYFLPAFKMPISFHGTNFLTQHEENWAKQGAGMVRAGVSPGKKFFWRLYANAMFAFSPLDNLAATPTSFETARTLWMPKKTMFLANDALLMFVSPEDAQKVIVMPTAAKDSLPEKVTLRLPTADSFMTELVPQIKQIFPTMWPSNSKEAGHAQPQHAPFLSSCFTGRSAAAVSDDGIWRVEEDNYGYWLSAQ